MSATTARGRGAHCGPGGQNGLMGDRTLAGPCVGQVSLGKEEGGGSLTPGQRPAHSMEVGHSGCNRESYRPAGDETSSSTYLGRAVGVH